MFMFGRIARFIKNISFIVLSWQGNFLQKRLKKKFGYKPAVKGCSVDLNTESSQIDIERLNNEARTILKRCKNNSAALIEFIKEHNTGVYMIKHGKLFFNLLGEDEGFIAARTGFKAFMINLVAVKKVKFKSEPAFLLNSGEIDIYNLIHYFHKWLAFKDGMMGFDEKSQGLLRKLNSKNEDDIISRLSLTEIDMLKSAIARDVQSIDFVEQYAKENAGAKKAYKKLQTDDGTNI